MNFHAIYPICNEPVQLEKVTDGLWVSTPGVQSQLNLKTAQADVRDAYLLSVDIFKQPMRPADFKHKID
jgi:hypothetical protein